MAIHKTNSITNYLDNIAPFYYFLIIPFVIALIVICFDFEFIGILSNTQQLQISSKHKFLNDFFCFMYLDYNCSYILYPALLSSSIRSSPNVRETQRTCIGH